MRSSWTRVGFECSLTGNFIKMWLVRPKYRRLIKKDEGREQDDAALPKTGPGHQQATAIQEKVLVCMPSASYDHLGESLGVDATSKSQHSRRKSWHACHQQATTIQEKVMVCMPPANLNHLEKVLACIPPASHNHLRESLGVYATSKSQPSRRKSWCVGHQQATTIQEKVLVCICLYADSSVFGFHPLEPGNNTFFLCKMTQGVCTMSGNSGSLVPTCGDAHKISHPQ